MSHFTNEHFNQLQRSREQCISFLGMNNERLENFKTFDDLHQRIYGYRPADKQALLERQQEETLHSHRHANSHQKWYRIIKTLLRSTGLTKLNNTMAKLLMESEKRKSDWRSPDGVNGVVEYDTTAIFPIFNYIQHEVPFAVKRSYNFSIYNKNSQKYKLVIQNILYNRSVNTLPATDFKFIPYTEVGHENGVSINISSDDLHGEGVHTTPIVKFIFRVNVVLIPKDIYTNIINDQSLTLKVDEEDDSSSARFVKELTEKAKKLSKQSLPPKGNILPRY